ncbi:hypothetical protein AYR54_08135 [Loigolactobacillus backii]|uniref:C40 family peptidase n=1 Tax=Loigolactobacillus backii TaxID=375175 RepID=UPI0007F151D6|nr:C40 family peptidase [Loigolactobacillus backii]ANK60326.1 hypothetical protein AYR52_08735 [Loigolactobacillus backii]ANK65206.1 hypothetical protein AYR54_08135 [Loigolactobacillus backii]ANK67765.1 hypothetical protein AYR55_08745 [Loigolactobacillus backii]OLF70476.1 hypothetical protein ACX53_02400 [Loigolactobacillus backii]PIO87010.1 hypothetical protein B8A32_07595 [Loigolactobacillus backii]
MIINFKKNLLTITATGIMGLSGAALFGATSAHANAAEYNPQTAQTTAWYSSNTNNTTPTVTPARTQTTPTNVTYTNNSNNTQATTGNTTSTQIAPTTVAYTGNSNAQATTATVNAQTTPTTTSTQTTAGAQAAVNAAIGQVGTPYVWGGTTAGVGFDCSGLTQYALAQAGVTVGHYTVDQESAGVAEPLDQLQPGDLVFWGAQGASYHVALYIGNNQYVSAPQPGQNVEIQTINSYFQPSFGVRVNY